MSSKLEMLADTTSLSRRYQPEKSGLPNLSRNPPLDIRLGDVLVGLPVGDNAGLVDYDLGKETGTEGFQLLRAGHALAKTATVVRSAIGSIKLRAPNNSNDVMQHYKRIEHKEHAFGTFADPGQGRDMLYQINENGIECPVVRELRPDSERIRVWYGPIGSGDKLMKNADKRNELRDKYNIIGLEMEAAGTMDQIPVGIIRGVCDYGDEHKNDEWQPYAAAMAAAYARAVLAEILPENMVPMPSVDVSPKRKLDEEGSASGNEDRKRQCYAERGKHPATETTDNEVKKSLIEQLYFDKIDERLMNLTAAQGRTCCWFLDKLEYISWNDASQRPNHGGFLWIKGHPGTGKSTLMKFLFERTKVNAKGDSLQIILSFFFLARGTVEEKSTMGLYRSLLHQLFQKVPETQKGLEWMTRDGAKVIQRNGWNEKALKQTLAHAARELGNRSLTIFIDALDECNKNQVADMLCFFEELCESAQELQIRLQVCFSSRHYPTITIGKGIEVNLEDEPGHTKDIEYYINSKLRLGKSNQALLLRSEILDRSSNIFLWVVLVLDILNREYPNTSISIKKMRDRLKEIPPELNDLFEMILTRDSEDLDRLRHCLIWILFSNRPLKPQELYFAVQLSHDTECLGYWDQDDIAFEEIKTFVSSSSKGLAEVTRNKASEVQFIHESVRDFLLNKYESEWFETSGNFRGNSHKLLKNCCLAQLNSLVLQDIGIIDPLPPASETAQLRHTISLNYPFLEYAVLNALHHANGVQQNGIGQEHFLADFPLKKWITLHNTFEQHQIRRYTDSVSLLYILAERNLVNLIGIHPKKFSFFDIEDETERYGTPIFAALAINNYQAVHVFLKTLAAKLPPGSPLHELCELYRWNKTSSRIFRRDFTFRRKAGILHYLQAAGDETLICAFLSLRGPSALLDDACNRMSPSQTTWYRDGGISDSRWNEANIQDAKLLSWAAENGYKGAVQLLLEKSSLGLNHEDDYGQTPLLLATKRGHEDITQLLLAQDDIDPNNKDKYGQTPLLWAARNGYEVIVKMLLAHDDTDPDNKDKFDQTPLLWAARNGHEAIVKMLLAHDVDPDNKDKYDHTPLLWATENGHEAIVQMLLTQDVDPNYRSPSTNQTLVSVAAMRGHEAVVQVLLAHGVDPDSKNTYMQSPLLLAAAIGHEAVVQVVLAQGGINLNYSGEQALLWAATSGHEAIVQMILAHGVDPDCKDAENRTPLLLAAANGNEGVVQMLTQVGVNLNHKDDRGKTPLLYAITNSHKAVVQLLLTQDDIDPDCEDEFSRTPLLWAAKSGHEAVIQLLLAQDLNLSCRDIYDRTPLLLAAANGHEVVVQLLLTQGVDPDCKDNCGQTPLLWAAANGHESVVQLLLTQGVDPDCKDNNGLTPLLWAVKRGHKDVVQLLLAQDGMSKYRLT
ncbi:ankyrin repeats (3 copies) domain-containing protein [Trichoderma breve]|uniref:Ankyrin repeats (3 copies) domain-containing protein n=1 Tax=Trichoderma breve TaxID=2034170 RepID=A0A9W9BDB9_9HYPO|nr:ankyrin repeats (3 copies) domain-containing protein [Trichoderma breve]KAJ4861173.1 ankyrin repeats (3 copies) domain-containing protein [Trichoderma breve]